jgi:adenylate cyclase
MDPHFQELLLEYAHASKGAKMREIEHQLWERFGATKAVLVLDMSGFSLLSRRYGVVHYLSMVRRMQLTAQEVVDGHGGEVVKFEADNCFAAFPDVAAAVSAAIALNQTFHRINLDTADEYDIRIAIGIDHGRILLIGGPDYFGDAVNTASKLGEDTANAGEILLTQRAWEQLPQGAGRDAEELHLSMSGIEITAYKVRYDPAG